MCYGVEKFNGYTLTLTYISQKLRVSHPRLYECVRRKYRLVKLGNILFLHQGLGRIGDPNASLPDMYYHLLSYAAVRAANDSKDAVFIPLRRVGLKKPYTVAQLLMLMWPNGDWWSKGVYVFKYTPPRPLEEVVQAAMWYTPSPDADKPRRVQTQIVSFHVPSGVLRDIDELAAAMRKTRSDIVRLAIEELIERWRKVNL
ncbi:MAG: ribbon-helix-helix domain-containing protein [Pyrobaculum sp.]